MSYYDSIYTCPVRIFSHVMKTGDYDALTNGRVYKHKGKYAWKRLMDEFCKEFGLPEDYKAYLKLRVQASKLYAKAIDKKHYITMARVKEQQAEALIRSMNGESQSLLQTAAMISRELGFAVDVNTCTVAQFYSYLNLLQNGK